MRQCIRFRCKVIFVLILTIGILLSHTAVSTSLAQTGLDSGEIYAEYEIGEIVGHREKGWYDGGI